MNEWEWHVLEDRKSVDCVVNFRRGGEDRRSSAPRPHKVRHRLPLKPVHGAGHRNWITVRDGTQSNHRHSRL